jgi:hypothetical protein
MARLLIRTLAKDGGMSKNKFSPEFIKKLRDEDHIKSKTLAEFHKRRQMTEDSHIAARSAGNRLSSVF